MKNFITLFFLLVFFSLSAQPRDTTFKFYSLFVKDSFTINIGEIIKSSTDSTLYPVYTLDGDETFMGSKLALKSLSELRKNILLISIGYGATFGKKGNMRDRDYSPIKSNTPSGSNFLHFISDELIPFTEHNYQIKKERTLLGYSAGANFCLYTLLVKQDLFTNYLAGSIGSRFDSTYYFDNLKKTKFHKSNTKLFISSGSKENWAIEKMSTIVKAFNLKNKNMIIKEQIFEGMEHGIMGAFSFIKESLKWTFIDN